MTFEPENDPSFAGHLRKLCGGWLLHLILLALVFIFAENWVRLTQDIGREFIAAPENPNAPYLYFPVVTVVIFSCLELLRRRALVQLILQTLAQSRGSTPIGWKGVHAILPSGLIVLFFVANLFNVLNAPANSVPSNWNPAESRLSFSVDLLMLWAASLAFTDLVLVAVVVMLNHFRRQ